MTSVSQLKDSVIDINERADKAGRNVGIYALFHMIAADTDEQAAALGQQIIDQADNGALNNILASASLDTNTGGTSDQLKAGLTQNIDDGNLAFMGIPVIHGSFETVARNIDSFKQETGIDGMLFSWPDFVSGVRDFGERVKPLLD
jgi:pyrimidine oxygenase